MSVRAVVMGLPVSLASSKLSSVWLSNIFSPNFISKRPRSSAVIFPQGPSSAALAARTATSTSAASPRGMVSNFKPSTGDSTSKVLPDTAETDCPLISIFAILIPIAFKFACASDGPLGLHSSHVFWADATLLQDGQGVMAHSRNAIHAGTVCAVHPGR